MTPTSPASRPDPRSRRTELPSLPVTFRPWRARWVLGSLAVTVTICLSVLAVILPPPARGAEGFGTNDRIGFLILIVLIVAGLALLARPRVRADASGLDVINVARRHRLAWAQVVAVHMRPGDAWMVLDLDDGTTLNAMGIQAADGARAQEQAAQVAGLVADRSRPLQND